MKIKRIIYMLLLLPLISACEHAFPNDDLDYYWRLQTIERAGRVETVDSVMFGFARHIVMVENYSSNGFTLHGVTTDTADSLRLDFSMYPDSVSVLPGLRRCGIDSVVITFRAEYPKDRLVLSNDKVVLRFRKW